MLDFDSERIALIFVKFFWCVDGPGYNYGFAGSFAGNCTAPAEGGSGVAIVPNAVMNDVFGDYVAGETGLWVAVGEN